MGDQRLKGQEVAVRVVKAGQVVEEITLLSSFNDNTDIELKSDGFLGENTNRFDEILNGYGGDFESQVAKASWLRFKQAVEDRATRKTPDVEFNVVRSDFYPNGDTAVITYLDVHWGPIPTNVPSRGDFVKIKFEFKCSEQPIQLNQLP